MSCEDWTQDEVEVVVDAYLTMLRMERQGQRYVKAEFNRKVQAQTGRSKGSVEYKLQNVSEVMVELELPRIKGYKPAEHKQALLRNEVERRLKSGELDWLSS